MTSRTCGAGKEIRLKDVGGGEVEKVGVVEGISASQE